MTPRELLDLPLADNDAEAGTVREYLVALLVTLWQEEEGFSGKRPFGNSSWQYDIYVPMITAGVVSGSLDEDGYVEECDTKAADAMILTAIGLLGDTSAGETA